MNKYRRLKVIGVAAVIALAMTGCTVALDRPNESGSINETNEVSVNVDSDEVINKEINEEIKKIAIESKKVNEETEAYIVEVDIPILKGFESDSFEKRINEEMNDSVSTFVETIKNYAVEIKEEGYLSNPYYAGVNYSVQLDNSNYISLIIHYNEYTGGAHGNYFLECITYDLQSEKVLQLSDFFIDGSDYMTVLENAVTKAIEDKRKTSEYGEQLHSWYEGLDEEYVNYTLEEDSIGIHFMPYQIGPYAEGGPSFMIPLETFEEILAINDY